MTCYIVTFQTKSEESRNKIIEVLKGYDSYCPIHNYCWAIETEEKSGVICDKIKVAMDSDERLFVIRSGTEAAWTNSYGDKNTDWLKENL